jgi:hypothetical protein
LTPLQSTGHNGDVRRFLLALVFGAVAWAAIAHPVTPTAGAGLDTIAAGGSADAPSASPAGPDDSDSAWIAAARTHISVTESLWKSSDVHAELAGARPGVVNDEAMPDRRGDRPDRDGSAHLRHIPLRI